MLWIPTSLLCCKTCPWQQTQREDPGEEMYCSPGPEPPAGIVLSKWVRDNFYCFYFFTWVGQEHHLATKLMQLLPGPGLKQSAIINFACIPLVDNQMPFCRQTPQANEPLCKFTRNVKQNLLTVKSETFLPWGITSQDELCRQREGRKHAPVSDASHGVTFFSLFIFQLLAVVRGRSSLCLRGTGGCCRFGI